MKKVKVAVLRSAGCNCDGETVHAFELSGATTELIHVNEFIRREKHLSEYHILAIPGGFTYGDDISAGKILANELKFLMTDEIKKFTDDGKLIIGICNGFQVMVKAGLFPEVTIDKGEPELTLTFNDSGKFEDRWVHLKVNENSKCIFTKNMPEIVYYPVAHAEGKLVTKNDEVLNRLKANGQIVFQYCTEDGQPVGYPGNPNGSAEGITGICDPSGRILGLMPHPERYVHPTHHPRWTREGQGRQPEGLKVFQNAVEYARENL